MEENILKMLENSDLSNVFKNMEKGFEQFEKIRTEMQSKIDNDPNLQNMVSSLKKTFEECEKSDEFSLDELVHLYTINQQEKNKLEEKIEKLDQDVKKEFWAKYYGISVERNDKIDTLFKLNEEILEEIQILSNQINMA